MTMRSMSCVLAAGLMLAAAACEQPSGTASAASVPPPMMTPVGPIPGPSQNPQRPANPYTNDRTAMGEGRQLFVRFNCSGCHGGRAGGGMGPSLRDVDWLYGNSEAQIFSSIAEGRAHGMPAWGMKLNEDQLWKLVAYIKSLRTPNEIQPPG
jgi:cytochrome c oxidase cbb3-type subunit 3